MRLITKGTNFRTIGEDTGVHPETVRRYLTDGRPSAYFVASLCKTFGVSAEWLLFGEGGPFPGARLDGRVVDAMLESKPPCDRD